MTKFLRSILVALALLSQFVLIFPVSAESTAKLSGNELESNRWNVLLIVADDMGYADMGCAGHPLLKTPNLDKLASKGVRFTHTFTPFPIWSTSRAAILTGMDSWSNGCLMNEVPIKPGTVQFPELLAKSGYECHYIGKWHNDGKPWTRGFTSGSYQAVGGMYPREKGGQAKPWVTDFGSDESRQIDRFSTSLFCDGAVDFLDQHHAKEKPFLLYLSLTVPHDPWMPPDEYLQYYPKESISLPENFLSRPRGRWFTDWHGTHLRDQVLMPFPRTPDGVRDVRQRYYATVTHMDHEIGRVLDKLEEKNLSRKTVVIFLGDHGISLGSHGFSGKQTMYEEGIRTPCIVSHPGLDNKRRINSNLVSLVDLFPTICDIAGVKVPDEVEGESLLGLYQDTGKTIRREVFTTFISEPHRWNVRAIRTERYKFIKHFTTDEVELFDLQCDPYETVNLADSKSCQQIRQTLATKLAEWRKRSGDQRNDRMPVPVHVVQ